jgi:hypothetical protein
MEAEKAVLSSSGNASFRRNHENSWIVQGYHASEELSLAEKGI